MLLSQHFRFTADGRIEVSEFGDALENVIAWTLQSLPDYNNNFIWKIKQKMNRGILNILFSFYQT